MVHRARDARMRAVVTKWRQSQQLRVHAQLQLYMAYSHMCRALGLRWLGAWKAWLLYTRELAAFARAAAAVLAVAVFSHRFRGWRRLARMAIDVRDEVAKVQHKVSLSRLRAHLLYWGGVVGLRRRLDALRSKMLRRETEQALARLVIFRLRERTQRDGLLLLSIARTRSMLSRQIMFWQWHARRRKESRTIMLVAARRARARLLARAARGLLCYASSKLALSVKQALLAATHLSRLKFAAFGGWVYGQEVDGRKGAEEEMRAGTERTSGWGWGWGWKGRVLKQKSMNKGAAMLGMVVRMERASMGWCGWQIYTARRRERQASASVIEANARQASRRLLFLLLLRTTRSHERATTFRAKMCYKLQAKVFLALYLVIRGHALKKLARTAGENATILPLFGFAWCSGVYRLRCVLGGAHMLAAAEACTPRGAPMRKRPLAFATHLT